MSEKKREQDHKQEKAIIIGVAILIIAVLVGYFGFYYPAQVQNEAEEATKEEVARNWDGILSEAEILVAKAEQLKSFDGAFELSDDIDDVVSKIEDASEDYDVQDNFRDRDYEDSLDSTLAYLRDLTVAISIDKTDVTGETFEATKSSQNAAKDDVEEFVKKTEVDDIEELAGLFEIVAILEGLHKTYVDEANAEVALAEEQAAQARADDAAVEEAATFFTTDYIQGDEGGLMQSMTASFQSEFDYERLGEDFFSYPPASYRITDKVKDTDDRYYVYGRMTYKQRDGDDQYIGEYNLTVIRQDGEWLVDIDSAPRR